MADITKIIRGMQNGAETIDNNFSKMNTEMKQTADASVKIIKAGVGSLKI